MKKILGASSELYPGFSPIPKQVDHTLDHKGLWFQADNTLENIWSKIWSAWTINLHGPEYDQSGTINPYGPDYDQLVFV